MTLILSGTDGLSDIDGSAATPAIRGTDANTGIFFPAADTIAFSEGGTEAMRIDSSGNVGVGTSSPGTRVHASIASATAYTTSSRANVLTVQNTTAGGYAGIEFLSEPSSGNAGIAGINSFAPATGDSVLTFSTRSSATLAERARIDSSGNVGIGTTSITNPQGWGRVLQITNSGSSALYLNDGTANLSIAAYSGRFYFTSGATTQMVLDPSGNLLVGTTTGAARVYVKADGAIVDPVTVNNTNTTANSQYAILFVRNSSTVGSIQTTNSATSYNTSSDYRLKENIAPMTGALATVAALKPCTYTWKVDGSAGQGFIAHELAEVVPDCVTGEKDATRMEQYEISPAVPATYDEEGNELTPAVAAVIGEREVPAYQGIDTSFLVATLTAAIQEQQAIIQSLTARIEALEGK